jgi:hypothetical protein
VRQATGEYYMRFQIGTAWHRPAQDKNQLRHNKRRIKATCSGAVAFFEKIVIIFNVKDGDGECRNP